MGLVAGSDCARSAALAAARLLAVWPGCSGVVMSCERGLLEREGAGVVQRVCRAGPGRRGEISCAVEKTPAWPATPPMRRVVGSWTVPRRRWSKSGLVSGSVAFVVVGGGGDVVDACAVRPGVRRAGHVGCGRGGVAAASAMAAPMMMCGPQALSNGQVAGVGHAERLEDVLADVDVFGLAAELFDEGAEQDEVDVGVDEVCAGGACERSGEGAADAFGFVGCGEAPGVFEVDVGGFAGGVGEEHADGDFGALRVVGGVEVGQVFLDGVVEAGDLAGS